MQQRYDLQGYDLHDLGYFRWKRPKDGFLWVDNFDWADNFQWGNWTSSWFLYPEEAELEPKDEPITALIGLASNVLNKPLKEDFRREVQYKAPLLVPKELVDKNGQGFYAIEYCYPMEEEGALFLKFSRLNPESCEDILAFANRWGKLFSDDDEGFFFVNNVHVKRTPNGGLEWGIGRQLFVRLDSYREWAKEIVHMKRLVSVWEMIQEAEKDTDNHIRPLVRWDERNKRILFTYENWVVVITKNAVEYEAIPNGDYIAALRFFLMKEINRKLDKNHVRFRLLWDVKKQRIKPHVVPTNLLGAMYYQFYQAVTREKKFKRCVVCGQWEQVEQSNWLYHKHCGNTWRSRKKRGLDAIRRGKKTPTQVALELGVSEEEVLGWLQSL